MKNMLTAFALALSTLTLVGCAADGLADDETSSTTEAELGDGIGDCDGGFYTCPLDHKIFEYGTNTYNCRDTPKPTAHARCVDDCRIGTHHFECTDSGWGH